MYVQHLYNYTTCMYCVGNTRLDWALVATVMAPERSVQDCISRHRRIMNSKLLRGLFKPDEVTYYIHACSIFMLM